MSKRRKPSNSVLIRKAFGPKYPKWLLRTLRKIDVPTYDL